MAALVAQSQPGVGAGSASTMGMRFISNQEIDERQKAEQSQITPVIDGLSSYISKLWTSAEQAKERISFEMLEDYRQRIGIYSEQKLAQIRQFGGSEIFMMLTSEKCRSAEARLRDIYNSATDKAWSLSPTPLADLPPEEETEAVEQVMEEVQVAAMLQGRQIDDKEMLRRLDEINSEIRSRLKKKAKRMAERMSDKIEDQLVEGNWQGAFNEFLFDLVTSKGGILKGPLIRKRKTLKWGKVESDGVAKHKPIVGEEYYYTFERVSPLDIYPSADATDVDDGYLFQRHYLSISQLNAMRGLKGVREEVIKEVIERYWRGGFHNLHSGDQQRARIEQREYAYWPGRSYTIEAKEFNGPLPGHLLIEWGMDVKDPSEIYECNAWYVNGLVFKATLNEDPLGRRDYYKAAYEEIPGSFWGYGLSWLVKDCQQMCNACARAITNNMGIASGPQVIINDTSRIPEGTKITSIYPWKIWQFGPDKGTNAHRPPVEFFQPSPMVDALIIIYNKFSQIADQVAGVPSYPFQEVKSSGAGSTASGLSMMLNSANIGIKRIVGMIDIKIIEKVIGRMHEMNMLYSDDESIKGDVKAKARGASSLIAKEQHQLRRQEFLSATNNQVDLQIMGIEGRQKLLKEVAKALDMDVDEIVPDDEDKLMDIARNMIDSGQLNNGAQPGNSDKPQVNNNHPESGNDNVNTAGDSVNGQESRLF